MSIRYTESGKNAKYGWLTSDHYSISILDPQDRDYCFGITPKTDGARGTYHCELSTMQGNKLLKAESNKWKTNGALNTASLNLIAVIIILFLILLIIIQLRSSGESGLVKPPDGSDEKEVYDMYSTKAGEVREESESEEGWEWAGQAYDLLMREEEKKQHGAAIIFSFVHMKSFAVTSQTQRHPDSLVSRLHSKWEHPSSLESVLNPSFVLYNYH